MSISSATNRNDYTGNGAVDTYDYTFRIFAQGDLLVTVKDTDDVETTLTITTDYTVTGVGEASGGTVVLVNSSQAWLDGDGDLLTGYTLTIRRVVDLVQETDIRNQGDFYPEVHEDALDYLTMIDQQQQDELDRSVKLPESILSSAFDPTLPTTITTANSTIITNSSGNGFSLGPTANEISSAQTYANNASTSATAAAASASAAATSEGNAAAVLASAFFRGVINIDNTDSPVTVAQAQNGYLYAIDSSGGAITISLPEISGLSLPFNIAFVLKTAGNTVTINRSSTDTIDGGTSKTLSVIGSGYQITADDSTAPDEWTSISWGSIEDAAVTTAKLNDSVFSGLTAVTAAANDYVPIADTSDSNNKKKALVSDFGVPAGSIQAYVGATAPTGWLLCHGAEVSRTTYATLYAVIGDKFGSGDGSTTFDLPDLRGRFLRGWDNSAGNDPNAGTRTAIDGETGAATGDNIGSYQAGATKLPTTSFTTGNNVGNHSHNIPIATAAGGATSYAAPGNTTFAGYSSGSTSTESSSHTHTVTGGGDSETRPVNVYVNYIIKY